MSRSGDSLVALEPAARAGVAEAADRARTTGQTRWVARVIEVEAIDPLAGFARSQAQDRFFWEQVDTGEAFCAWGVADETESAGRRRFEDVRAWSERVRERIHWLGCERPASSPLLLGGFGFEDDPASSEHWKSFPPARFVLPAVLGERRDGRMRWVLLARIEPGVPAATVEGELEARLGEALDTQRPQTLATQESETAARDGKTERAASERRPLSDPSLLPWASGPEYRVQSDRPHEVYTAQVARALDEIGRGRLQKVVLARSLRVDHEGSLDVPGFLDRLRSIYSSCALIAMARGEDTFLAATPETLVRLRDRDLSTAALAGSAPRGRSPEEDRALGAALEASEKDRAEHAHVVEAIRDAIEPFCETLEIPAEPRLRGLFGIQHLETPVSGRLREAARSVAGARPVDVLDLVSALHPTPAVGGVPAPAAREWLRRFEGLDRGWYAAPLGWLDAGGGGDFRVALRSGLLRSRRPERSGLPPEAIGESHAWLFAGAGIVDGSQPEQELAETRIKLRALLAPLTEI